MVKAKTNRSQIRPVGDVERVRLCLHEKNVDRYEFRCSPSLARLLRERGPEWVREALLEKLRQEK